MKATLVPYLMFVNHAKDAMEFYKSILGGELIISTYKDAGFPHDPKDDDKVVHSELKNDWMNIMASEGDPEHPVTVGNNVQLSLVGTDEELLKGFFEKLSEGGKVRLPLEKQFWGDIYGQVTDKYGVYWSVNISSENPKK